MRRKKQIGPPHFLFWSFNQPPWWIMGNVWSRPCDPLSFTCQPHCSYNWNWDIGKQVNATFHWAAKWEKNPRKTTPTFIPSSALTRLPCTKWMQKGSLMDHREEVFCCRKESEENKFNFSFPFPFHENCIYSSYRNVKTVATISCLVTAKNNNVHFQNLAKRGTSFETGTKLHKTVKRTWMKSKNTRFSRCSKSGWRAIVMRAARWRRQEESFLLC